MGQLTKPLVESSQNSLVKLSWPNQYQNKLLQPQLAILSSKLLQLSRRCCGMEEFHNAADTKLEAWDPCERKKNLSTIELGGHKHKCCYLSHVYGTKKQNRTTATCCAIVNHWCWGSGYGQTVREMERAFSQPNLRCHENEANHVAKRYMMFALPKASKFLIITSSFDSSSQNN